MSGARLALLLLAAAALVAAVLWWRAPAPPADTRPAARAFWPVPPSGPAAPPPAAGAAPAPAPLAAALLRAALVERLRSAALSPARLERLAAGDVAGVAQGLAAAREPGGAALLAELAALCRELEVPGTDADAAAARAALAGSRAPAAGAALEALIGARRAAEQRLAAGCGATRFDAAAIERELAASGRDGDAASLERLALVGSGGPGKLTSAALLGAPRAQLRLGLDQLRDQPAVARSWLEAAARHDADAEAFYGSCLLAGCGAPPDPAAARAALESAARHGAAFALGLLSSAPGADAAQHWAPAGAPVVPLPPTDPDALGLGAADRYAWAALAGRLAERGCFGFDVRLAAEALAARPRLERAFSLTDVAAGERAAAELEAASGPALRALRGCE